ncbi:uncharacterized protein LOC109851854 [Pseudomyrmex gracilis]|uniref:uncharacterized protein LOC109851854 n=1 Tax=Pseudomyrmex gracilis TaxID=219809 RepID=UPI00099531D4|nr:uncharacterized protein LOC109851854 [Pseudomyrmex gracilis]
MCVMSVRKRLETYDNDVAQLEDVNDENYEDSERVVRFASSHTSISPDEDYVPACLINENQDGSNNVSHNMLKNKSVQTFFKYMINLSNRRFVEIINTPVNHEDKSLVFYCRSDESLSEEQQN